MGIFKFSVEDDARQGGLLVKADRDNTSVIYVLTDITVTREEEETGKIVTMKTYAVESSTRAAFSFVDLSAIAGVYYTYTCEVKNGNNVLETLVASGMSTFDGLLIADENESWITRWGTSDSEFKIDLKRNTQVNYVTTLSGKMPHRVANANTNYVSGTVNALFVPLGENCGEPDFSTDPTLYREAFMEFLCNNNEKLLKLNDGRAYIVSIDSSPYENWNKRHQLSTVTFSWTEIGEIDKPKYRHTGCPWIKAVE